MKKINNEADYENALERIEKLIDIDPIKGTSEADELDNLVFLVKEYEDEKYPIK